jgi:hypothetical protein
MRLPIRSLVAAGLAGLAMLLALLASPAAQAGIVSVDTAQDRLAVSATGPSTVTVTWLVVRDNGTTLPNPGTVSSSSGRFLVNGVVVGTVSRTLSRTTPGVTPGQQTLVFTEAVTVPQAVVFRAIKARVPIVFERTFSTTGTIVPPAGASLPGSINLNPSGPGSEPFSVSRLSLRFDDQSRVKVLSKGSRLRAVAELNTTGQGLVEAVWEIAPATTTAGTPVFQTLALVRRPVAFGGRTVITSPPLPTRFEGSNLVRLRITDPQTFFDEPELQYYVTPESPLPEQQEPSLLLITAPSPGTPLTLTTRFAWQAVPGTRLYKLEVFPAPPGPAEIAADREVTTPVPLDPTPDTAGVAGREALTGAVVPGTQTEIRLQDYSLAHLPAGRRYLWMVKAIDPNGALLGVSPPREIYKP